MTGQALIAISQEEAKKLSDAAYKVALEYDLVKYFQGKTPALVALGLVAVSIYMPKMVMLVMISKMQRAAAAATKPKSPDMSDIMTGNKPPGDVTPPHGTVITNFGK